MLAACWAVVVVADTYRTPGVSVGSTADTGVQVNPGQTTDDRDDTALRLAKGRQWIAHKAWGGVMVPEWDNLTPDEQEQAVTEARHWINAAVNTGISIVPAGRTVVDLPEPDEVDENIAMSGRPPILANGWTVDRWSAYAWVEGGVARVDVVTGPDDGTADHAERCGVMLIAAAREARRLAAEQSSGVGGDTR